MNAAEGYLLAVLSLASSGVAMAPYMAAHDGHSWRLPTRGAAPIARRPRLQSGAIADDRLDSDSGRFRTEELISEAATSWNGAQEAGAALNSLIAPTCVPFASSTVEHEVQSAAGAATAGDDDTDDEDIVAGVRMPRRVVAVHRIRIALAEVKRARPRIAVFFDADEWDD